jgi:hypothetical protein
VFTTIADELSVLSVAALVGVFFDKVDVVSAADFHVYPFEG